MTGVQTCALPIYVAGARAVHAQLLASFNYLNTEDAVFSMSIKAMLATLGQPVGDCRLPLPPAPAETAARARQVWAGLQA